MNNNQAKQILALYRPGTADGQDPSFAQALRALAQDPDLGRWFENHCASYLAMRQKLLDIPVPPGLKEQILSERPAPAPAEAKIIHPVFRRFAPVLVAAAAIVLLLVLGWKFLLSPQSGQAAYRAYRNRMITTATKAYAMALTTNDPQAVQAFLQRRQAPADFVLPQGLKNAQTVGCAIVPWDSQPVSMICFNSGRPLRPGQKSDLWLFVAGRSAMLHVPSSEVPAFEQTGWVITASWSQGGKTYLLAAPGDEAFLRAYL